MSNAHRIINEFHLEDGDVITIVEWSDTNRPTYSNFCERDKYQTRIEWKIIHEYSGVHDVVQVFNSFDHSFGAVHSAYGQYIDLHVSE